MQKKSNEKRIDFTEKVKREIAARVNYQCSVPRCKAPALAPNLEDPNRSINMGTACHIYAASSDGPRGQGGKDKAFIASVENGIWCCNGHGTRIDKASGKEFPAETLFMWKRLAEAKVSRLSTGRDYPYGWIESIELVETNFPVFSNNLPKVKLTKNVILHSRQEAGQSTLLEFISTAGDDGCLKRWNKSSAMLQGKINYSTLDEEVSYKLEYKNNRLLRNKNGVNQTLPIQEIAIIYLPLDTTNTEEDIIDYIKSILKVDLSTLNSILDDVSKRRTVFSGHYTIVERYVDTDDGKEIVEKNSRGENCYTLQIARKYLNSGEEYSVQFEALSGSEKHRVLLSLLLSKVRLLSLERPVLLMIGTRVLTLDLGKLILFLKILNETDIQVVLEAPWRYQMLFDAIANGEVIDEENFSAFGSQEILTKFNNQLENWSVKSIFDDSEVYE